MFSNTATGLSLNQFEVYSRPQVVNFPNLENVRVKRMAAPSIAVFFTLQEMLEMTWISAFNLTHTHTHQLYYHLKKGQGQVEGGQVSDQLVSITSNQHQVGKCVLLPVPYSPIDDHSMINKAQPCTVLKNLLACKNLDGLSQLNKLDSSFEISSNDQVCKSTGYNYMFRGIALAVFSCLGHH